MQSDSELIQTELGALTLLGTLASYNRLAHASFSLS